MYTTVPGDRAVFLCPTGQTSAPRATPPPPAQERPARSSSSGSEKKRRSSQPLSKEEAPPDARPRSGRLRTWRSGPTFPFERPNRVGWWSWIDSVSEAEAIQRAGSSGKNAGVQRQIREAGPVEHQLLVPPGRRDRRENAGWLSCARGCLTDRMEVRVEREQAGLPLPP
jgi:hypothetical protein